MNERDLRHAVLRYLRAALVMGWAGKERLSRAARAIAQSLRTRLVILRVSRGRHA